MADDKALRLAGSFSVMVQIPESLQIERVLFVKSGVVVVVIFVEDSNLLLLFIIAVMFINCRDNDCDVIIIFGEQQQPNIVKCICVVHYTKYSTVFYFASTSDVCVRTEDVCAFEFYWKEGDLIVD